MNTHTYYSFTMANHALHIYFYSISSVQTANKFTTLQSHNTLYYIVNNILNLYIKITQK